MMQYMQPIESCPLFGGGKKIKDHQEEYLWRILKENPQCSSRQALTMLAERGITLSISLRHVNRLRVKWELNRKKGRPSGKTQKSQKPSDKLKNIKGKRNSTKKSAARKIFL